MIVNAMSTVQLTWTQCQLSRVYQYRSKPKTTRRKFWVFENLVLSTTMSWLLLAFTRRRLLPSAQSVSRVAPTLDHEFGRWTEGPTRQIMGEPDVYLNKSATPTPDPHFVICAALVVKLMILLFTHLEYKKCFCVTFLCPQIDVQCSAHETA